MSIKIDMPSIDQFLTATEADSWYLRAQQSNEGITVNAQKVGWFGKRMIKFQKFLHNIGLRKSDEYNFKNIIMLMTNPQRINLFKGKNLSNLQKIASKFDAKKAHHEKIGQIDRLFMSSFAQEAPPSPQQPLMPSVTKPDATPSSSPEISITKPEATPSSAPKIKEMPKSIVLGPQTFFTSNYMGESNTIKELLDEVKIEGKDVADAMNELGRLFVEKHDYGQAIHWFTEAANKGSREGMFNLGLLHDIGVGVKQNYTEAMKWYRKAAEKGLSKAMTAVGMLYAHGLGTEHSDQTINDSLAREWYQIAHKTVSGPTNWGTITAARTNLAFMFATGRGGKKDDEIAKRLYRFGIGEERVGIGHTAKAYFNEVNSPDSLEYNFGLGFCYEHGLLTTKDEAKAIEFYEKADKLGCEGAKERAENLKTK